MEEYQSNEAPSHELSDDAVDTILNSLEYTQVHWPDVNPLYALHLATRVMYHAIGFDLNPQPEQEILSENCLRIWYQATIDFRIPFAWDEVSQGLEELRIANPTELEVDEDKINRRDLLQWLTMRLLKDVGDNCRNLMVWDWDMPDERIRKRICDLGAVRSPIYELDL